MTKDSKGLVSALRILTNDRRLLTESGLPAAASPFLSFGLCPDRVLVPLAEFPDSVPIEHNGSGDLLCIDQDAGGSVVYYNHDNHMQRVFMNSSLERFAECLCCFAEFMQTRDADWFGKQVEAVDPEAMAAGTFWPAQMQCELDC